MLFRSDAELAHGVREAQHRGRDHAAPRERQRHVHEALPRAGAQRGGGFERSRADGLERAPGGRVVVDGEVWQDDAAQVFVPTHRRAVGVVLMIGGNIPGATRVISTQLYSHVEALEYPAAHRLAALLLVFSFAVLLWVYRLRTRGALIGSTASDGATHA